jgi:hypothetical protein
LEVPALVVGWRQICRQGQELFSCCLDISEGLNHYAWQLNSAEIHFHLPQRIRDIGRVRHIRPVSRLPWANTSSPLSSSARKARLPWRTIREWLGRLSSGCAQKTPHCIENFRDPF